MESSPEINTTDVTGAPEIGGRHAVPEYLEALTLADVPVVAGDRNVGPEDDSGGGYKGL